MQRFYVLPLESPDGIHRGPKYLAWRFNPSGIATAWGMMDFGALSSAIVLCPDISISDDATLTTGHADVFAFPENIAPAISGADRLVMDGFFEPLNIPTDWLTGSSTYLQFLRTMAGLFQFAQRYASTSNGASIFDNGRNLSSRLNGFSAQERTWFDSTVASFGYPAPSGNPTLRQLAKQIGDLWGAAPFTLAGITF